MAVMKRKGLKEIMSNHWAKRGTALCVAGILMLGALSGCGRTAKVVSDSSSNEWESSLGAAVSKDVTSGDALTSEDLSESSQDSATVSSGNGKTGSNSKTDTPAKTDASVKGNIKVMYSEEKNEMDTILPVFKAKYPGITVTPVVVSGNAQDTPTQLSKMAAAKTLPDVTMGVENFGYIMKQGLAYPLDKLYNADPDNQYSFKQGVNNYTYFGHIYALPYRLQFSCVLVNLDLLDTLNLPEPEYDWTIDQFVDLAKKATTDKYSGINYVENAGDPTHGLDTSLMNSMQVAPYQQYGYNISTHTFNFTNGAWVNSKKIVKDLENVPGLVSDALKNQKAASGKTQYEEKFGGSGDALVAGKVLFGNHHSWEMTWMIDQFNFKWDMYPVPTGNGIPQRIQTHVDYVCLTTNVSQENRQAAYEFAKFLSYDKDGAIARMKYVESSKQKYGSYIVVIPASAHPDALAYFNSMKTMPNGVKYMLKTVMSDSNKVFIADCNKLIPNFWADVTQYRDQVDKKIAEGADPAALAQDLETKVNKAASTTWSSFETKVKKNAEEFFASHPYEK